MEFLTSSNLYLYGLNKIPRRLHYAFLLWSVYILVQSILRNDAVHSNEPIMISMNTKAINNN